MMMKKMKFGSLTVPLLLLMAAPAWAGMVDQNANNLSDLWETEYGWINGTHNASEDQDGDGFISSYEHEFGTDPFDHDSRPGSGAAVLVPPDSQLSFPTVSGIQYQPQAVEDLGNTWNNIGPSITGDGTVKSVTTAAPIGSTHFWRTLAITPLDVDSDGLNAYEEVLNNSSDATAFSDDDLWDDLTEYQNGTDAGNPDTDNDGVRDDKDANPNDPADGFPQNPQQRQYNVRLIIRGTYPDPLALPIPPINLAVGTTANLTQASVNTNTATGGGTYTSTIGVDKLIDRGKDYPFTLSFSAPLWPTVEGRLQEAPSQPAADLVNLLIFSPADPGSGLGDKGWYISNPDGGVWPEATWQATGFPTLSNPPNQPLEAQNHSAATLYAVNFDLDIDSDNNDNQSLMVRSLAEDDVEATQAKHVFTNSDDDDEDGTVDTEDLAVSSENDLIPLVLEVAPEALEWDKVQIKFEYNGSSTYIMDSQEPIRIWRTQTAGRTRVEDEYIKPNHVYNAGDLGLSEDSTQLKLFVEGVAATPSDETIKAVLLFAGNEPAREYFSDQVLVKILGVDIDVDTNMDLDLDNDDAGELEKRCLIVDINNDVDGDDPAGDCFDDTIEADINDRADMGELVLRKLEFTPDPSWKLKLKVNNKEFVRIFDQNDAAVIGPSAEHGGPNIEECEIPLADLATSDQTFLIEGVNPGEIKVTLSLVDGENVVQSMDEVLAFSNILRKAGTQDEARRNYVVLQQFQTNSIGIEANLIGHEPLVDWRTLPPSQHMCAYWVSLQSADLNQFAQTGTVTLKFANGVEASQIYFEFAPNADGGDGIGFYIRSVRAGHSWSGGTFKVEMTNSSTGEITAYQDGTGWITLSDPQFTSTSFASYQVAAEATQTVTRIPGTESTPAVCSNIRYLDANGWHDATSTSSSLRIIGAKSDGGTTNTHPYFNATWLSGDSFQMWDDRTF